MAKTNDPLATRRKGNLPKSLGKVRQAEVVKGAANAAAKNQLRVDGEDGTFSVLPNSRIPVPPKSSK